MGFNIYKYNQTGNTNNTNLQVEQQKEALFLNHQFGQLSIKWWEFLFQLIRIKPCAGDQGLQVNDFYDLQQNID